MLTLESYTSSRSLIKGAVSNKNVDIALLFAVWISIACSLLETWRGLYRYYFTVA